jgi:hypothetical protein
MAGDQIIGFEEEFFGPSDKRLFQYYSKNFVQTQPVILPNSSHSGGHDLLSCAKKMKNMACFPRKDKKSEYVSCNDVLSDDLYNRRSAGLFYTGSTLAESQAV